MDSEVIILAQGPLNRLAGRFTTVRVPGVVVVAPPPELQPLIACGGATIVTRTIMQARKLGADRPTLVGWDAINAATPCSLVWFQLPEPGNSALKGIARYLELREQQGRRYERTIVLLGDVVYSWACLEAIFNLSGTYGFVGTKDLSLEGGELWGVAWNRDFEDNMLCWLRDALLRHPPVDDEYLHGQLRRWISGMRRGDLRNHVTHFRHRGAYIDIDDYTHDIDSPSDLVLMPELANAAAADDSKHGMSWTDTKEATMKGT